MLRNCICSVRFWVVLPLVLAGLFIQASRAEVVTEATMHRKLLELANTAVGGMPLDPHIRNRSRAQHKIVSTYLQVDDPQGAATVAAGIPDWRKAEAFAEISRYHAEKGDLVQSAYYFGKAEKLVELAGDLREGRLFASGDQALVLESLQEWRTDRVKATMAQASMARGDMEAVEKWKRTLGHDEQPKMVAYEASLAGSERFNEHLEQLVALAETEDFEAVKHAVVGMVQLHRKHYGIPERRERCREAILGFIGSMPLFIQIETHIELAQSAIDHADAAKALDTVLHANELLEGARYLPRLYYPMKSRIIALTFQSGKEAEALQWQEEACRAFRDRRDEVVDIHQAGILCRLAESALALGQREEALKLYRAAVDAGLQNGNSRPRADDLNEICCSLVAHGVVPGTDLMHALDEMKSKLGDPW